MEITNTEVFGFNAAIRAMRNPKDSWRVSDSFADIFNGLYYCDVNYNYEKFVLGKKDEELSQKLTKAGGEHCKHLRMILVWCDMTLPRYIWQEFDTYKHIEKISCSTMHKLTSYDLDNSFFEYAIGEEEMKKLNDLIIEYRETSDIDTFYRLKNKLPEGFLQKRTINANYQTLLNIYKQRKTHQLEQWKAICKWIYELPYFSELTGAKKYVK